MRQAGPEAELIVIDGASEPSTLELLQAHVPSATLVSEPDEGVYDAMNKGKALARGRFLWFLNGGDEALANWSELRAVLERPSEVLLSGYELAGANSSRVRKSRSPRSMWHALPTSHQAILYPAQEARVISYPTDYRVVADYAFTAKLYATGVVFRRESLVLARFHLDGMSTANARLIAPEANRVQREILQSGKCLRALSRVRHSLSRRYRQMLSGGAR